ncbi:MAG: flagellar hook-length control protein FliK [Desulfobacterales bacterium]|nr:flagellar hook-length control protein FliK [Desulfobacterales bacterium]
MIPGLPISSADILLSKDGEPSWSLLNLKTGQTVNAKVLDLVSPGKAMLLLSGQKVTAQTDLPLKPGMEIALQVTRDKGSILLKPVVPLPQGAAGSSAAQAGQTLSPALFFSKIAQAFPDLGSTKEPALQEILTTLSLKSGQRDDQFLPRILENLGLILEKKIGNTVATPDRSVLKPAMENLASQDLKAAVLNLISMESDDSAKSQTMRGIANALESFQQLNTQTGDSNRFLLPFPIWTNEQFEFGQILIDAGKKGTENEDKKVIRISFLMNMSALGAIRADFSILDKSVSGRFLLENQETCDYMRSLVPQLKERLSDIEYQARKIDCRVGESKSLAPTALVKAMAGNGTSDAGSNSGLDVVV